MWRAGRLAEERLLAAGPAAFDHLTAPTDGDDIRCSWAQANMPAGQREQVHELLAEVAHEIEIRWDDLLALATRLFFNGELHEDDFSNL